MAKLRVDCIYGGYHGQDPRTFTPDSESCSEQEMLDWQAVVDKANKEGWSHDETNSGCTITPNMIITKWAFGVGVYQVVIDSEGNFVRDATYDDSRREGEWEEEL